VACQIFVHVHLLGVQAATWFSTGLWDIPDNPSIPVHNIIVGQDWPGLSMKPMTDKSWEDACTIFAQSFNNALKAGIYPRMLIVKVLTEMAVKLAFDMSITLQIKVQQLGDTESSHLEARAAMQMFAGHAAVSVLHY
jgi:hypothetical protein